MQALLEENPEYREKLYIRGFLLTNRCVDDTDYPFSGQWIRDEISGYCLLTHPFQHRYVFTSENETLVMIGHAYQPFTMDYDENSILRKLFGYLKNEKEQFWSYFNGLTGVFTIILIREGEVLFAGDASGMQTTFYAYDKEQLLVTSHTMLADDLLQLKKSDYAERLAKYRFFPLLGNYLPGDMTQFEGLTRVTPNFYYMYRNGIVAKNRFFLPYTEQKPMEDLAKEAAEILHNSLELISVKWEHPAISLTGGCDSKTTLACANGLYDQFRYYSYDSSEAETVDVKAAGIICKELGLHHVIYTVPAQSAPEEHADIVGKILRWNCGNLLDSNPNDVRKRIVLSRIRDFDVEVKSWASEIGRSYYSKRFHGRTKFPKKPYGRACTTLYKFFLHNRKLVRETDRIFDSFIREYYQAAPVNPLPWFEQFFWEFRVPAWNGLVITGGHRYSSDITIPYNNRRLLTLFLSAPMEDRINDRMYARIRDLMNPAIDRTGVAVTNLHHTKVREVFEDLYWVMHSGFPL